LLEEKQHMLSIVANLFDKSELRIKNYANQPKESVNLLKKKVSEFAKSIKVPNGDALIKSALTPAQKDALSSENRIREKLKNGKQENDEGQDTLDPLPNPNDSLLVKRKSSQTKPQNAFSPNWTTFMKKANITPEKSVKHVTLSKYQYSLQPESNTFKGITPIVALDCEMVMVAGNIHELARCSIVNYNGHVLFDKLIKPTGKVTNYLTWVSGVSYEKLRGCCNYSFYKKEISEILNDKLVVGHSLKNDFTALGYTPNEKTVRDLAHFKPLNEKGKVLSLKKQTEKHLVMDIQGGEHDSVEDARASMELYKKFEKEWEISLKHSNYKYVKTQLLQDIKK